MLCCLDGDIRRHVRLEQLSVLADVDRHLVVHNTGDDGGLGSDSGNRAGEVARRKRIHSEGDGITGAHIGDVSLVNHGDKLQRVVRDDGDKGGRGKRCCNRLSLLCCYRGNGAADWRPYVYIVEIDLNQVSVPKRF